MRIFKNGIMLIGFLCFHAHALASLTDDIKTMLDNHEIMSEQQFINLAQRIVTRTSQESLENLTLEEAETAAKILEKVKHVLEKQEPSNNDTRDVLLNNTNQLISASDMLMDYAHPEDYYR